MEWQGIKDAPRDGSRVELKRQSGFTIHAQWLDLPSSVRNGAQWWSAELGTDPKLVDVPIDPVTHFRIVE